MDAFEQANATRKRIQPDAKGLYSIWGAQWAHLLVRLGRMDRARELTQANLEICRRNNWGDDVARCEWLLGRLDVTEGEAESAGEHLARAEATMRRGHMVAYLP